MLLITTYISIGVAITSLIYAWSVEAPVIENANDCAMDYSNVHHGRTPYDLYCQLVYSKENNN